MGKVNCAPILLFRDKLDLLLRFILLDISQKIKLSGQTVLVSILLILMGTG